MFNLNHKIFGMSDRQRLLGYLRRIGIVGTILSIGIFGAIQFDKIDFISLAREYQQAHPLLQFMGRVGQFVLLILITIINLSTARFMITPLLTIVFIFVAGAFYVKGIYGLPTFRDALDYITASMFAKKYPELVISKGEKQLSNRQTNLIDVVGGPGHVIVEPGNAAIFRSLNSITKVEANSSYFLAPFETIAHVINLDEQQIDRDEVTVITRDGIQVVIKDIHIRYRIKPKEINGRPVLRELRNPYPIDKITLQNVAFSTTVMEDGLESWDATVGRIVVGAITKYVAENTIDYLTAPSSNPANPRLELRNELLFRGIRRSLTASGAELLFIDTGHLHIVEDSVDSQRTDLWASDWVGDSTVTRAYAEAKRQAYQELGRAEAQAEIILKMMETLKDVAISTSSPVEVRKLLLLRTAQLLDSMSGIPKPEKDEK